MQLLLTIGIVVFLFALYKYNNQPRQMHHNDNRDEYQQDSRRKARPVNFRTTRRIGDVTIDDRNNLFKIKSARLRTFAFEDVIKYELNEDGQSITSGGLSIGRAIIGSAISPMGTLLGGLTGKRKGKDISHRMEIVVTMRGENQGLYRINIIDSKTNKLSKEYRRKVEEAEEIMALFDIKLDELY